MDNAIDKAKQMTNRPIGPFNILVSFIFPKLSMYFLGLPNAEDQRRASARPTNLFVEQIYFFNGFMCLMSRIYK